MSNDGPPIPPEGSAAGESRPTAETPEAALFQTVSTASGYANPINLQRTRTWLHSAAVAELTDVNNVAHTAELREIVDEILASNSRETWGDNAVALMAIGTRIQRGYTNPRDVAHLNQMAQTTRMAIPSRVSVIIQRYGDILRRVIETGNLYRGPHEAAHRELIFEAGYEPNTADGSRPAGATRVPFSTTPARAPPGEDGHGRLSLDDALAALPRFIPVTTASRERMNIRHDGQHDLFAYPQADVVGQTDRSPQVFEAFRIERLNGTYIRMPTGDCLLTSVIHREPGEVYVRPASPGLEPDDRLSPEERPEDSADGEPPKDGSDKEPEDASGKTKKDQPSKESRKRPRRDDSDGDDDDYVDKGNGKGRGKSKQRKVMSSRAQSGRAPDDTSSAPGHQTAQAAIVNAPTAAPTAPAGIQWLAKLDRNGQPMRRVYPSAATIARHEWDPAWDGLLVPPQSAGSGQPAPSAQSTDGSAQVNQQFRVEVDELGRSRQFIPIPPRPSSPPAVRPQSPGRNLFALASQLPGPPQPSVTVQPTVRPQSAGTNLFAVASQLPGPPQPSVPLQPGVAREASSVAAHRRLNPNAITAPSTLRLAANPAHANVNTNDATHWRGNTLTNLTNIVRRFPGGPAQLLRCHFCGGNASSGNNKYINGLKGFSKHMEDMHQRALTEVAALQHCTYHHLNNAELQTAIHESRGPVPRDGYPCEPKRYLMSTGRNKPNLLLGELAAAQAAAQTTVAPAQAAAQTPVAPAQAAAQTTAAPSTAGLSANAATTTSTFTAVNAPVQAPANDDNDDVETNESRDDHNNGRELIRPADLDMDSDELYE